MLLYTLKQAPIEKKILPGIIKLGLPIPKVFLDAPELLLGLELYYQAYLDLSTCRSGMGDGPIPWDRTMDYAAHVGLDADQADELWYCITQMDEAWMEYQEEKRKKA